MADMTREENIKKALATLVELCDESAYPDGETSDLHYHRRAAAEEVLRHYREEDLSTSLRDIHVTINGAMPVRPMTRVEMSG